MTLTDTDLERFARHIVLREIGGAGQMRLRTARVTLIGAGGIGSPAIQYCAAAGFGRLRVIDDDRVELSNLQRQTIFGTADIGAAKAEAAAAAVARLDDGVAVEPIAARVTTETVAALVADSDVVIDGCDNFATRLAVADACLAARIPLVSAAVAQFEGQLAVYRGWEADRPCYRCLVGGNPDRAEASCAEAGIIGALTGLIGSLAALEAIRAVVGFGDDPAGRLLLVDALAFRFRTIALPNDPGCPACAA